MVSNGTKGSSDTTTILVVFFFLGGDSRNVATTFGLSQFVSTLTRWFIFLLAPLSFFLTTTSFFFTSKPSFPFFFTPAAALFKFQCFPFFSTRMFLVLFPTRTVFALHFVLLARGGLCCDLVFKLVG
uniref:Uncharacterized protein n=1 Tax=Cacopsylla melanoneura TaxID=428564 RepID=A0A8D8PXB9_9HEMI